MTNLRMNALSTYAKRALPLVALLTLGFQGSTAVAQSDAQTGWPEQSRASETKSDGYILRANAYQSEYLPDGVAGEHNIEQGENEGVLHVVILEDSPNGSNETLPASVEVEQQNLLGQLESIEMKKVEENNYVSYIGTFNFDENAGFRFSITAEPDQSPETTLNVEFKDSFLQRR